MNQPVIFINDSLIKATGNDSLSGTIVYEVIRIVSEKPLFLEDHLRRLKSSAEMRLNFSINVAAVAKGIHSVIANNHLSNGNIEIQINQIRELLVKIIPHSYPSAAMYDQGICVDVLFAERSHPNAKEKNQALRDRANAIIQQEHLFEVLLVDRNGNITEGSRSNVFFVKGEQVYTSPTETVLQGITREKIVDICHQQQITIHEAPISHKQISSFEAAFLTGTSPAVLPIQKIGSQSFPTNNPIVQMIRSQYQILMQQNLSHFNFSDNL